MLSIFEAIESKQATLKTSRTVIPFPYKVSEGSLVECKMRR